MIGLQADKLHVALNLSGKTLLPGTNFVWPTQNYFCSLKKRHVLCPFLTLRFFTRLILVKTRHVESGNVWPVPIHQSNVRCETGGTRPLMSARNSTQKTGKRYWLWHVYRRGFYTPFQKFRPFLSIFSSCWKLVDAPVFPPKSERRRRFFHRGPIFWEIFWDKNVWETVYFGVLPGTLCIASVWRTGFG